MSATMFKAIVWKELRENLKWAVVVLLGMSAVLAIAISSLDNPLQGGNLNLLNLRRISNALDPTTMIGGLLAGLLIGAAQALVESRGDRWGFLAHRPVSRTTLFWGKATAGILLYAIATGLPVAVTLFRIALPGYLPIPFDWRIGLPALANLLCGLVFYFAGFLTGMRDAKWYVSRALGIGAAFCCLVLQEVAREFWQALAVCAAALIIVGPAAWGTFVAGGQYGAQPRIGRIATGASIGLGIAAIGWLVLEMNIARFAIDRTSGPPRYTTYTVTKEGMFVAITIVGNQVVEVSDPGGRPLEQYRNATRDQLRGAGLQTATLSRTVTTPSFRSTSRWFSQLRGATASDPFSWYYVDRLGLIAAYDIVSRKLVGWMGPDGFLRGEARPRPFAGRRKSTDLSYDDQRLLVLEDAVYRLDLDNRLVEKVFQPGPAESILDATTRPRDFEVIATTRRVIVQRSDGTRLLEAPQDARTLGYPMLQIWRAPQAPGSPTFLWYQGLTSQESLVSEYNSAGAVVNSWTLPPTSGVAGYSRLQIAITSVLTPLVVQASFGIVERMRQGSPSWSRPARNTNWYVAILSSLICAAAVFLRGIAYAFPPVRLSTWTGITLLLGPLGYLLMLTLIEWPARESCTACSRKRVVTRECCEHCGEPFAAPPQDGTEIFEPIAE